MVKATPRPLYPRGKTRHPLYRRLVGIQGRSGQVLKILPIPGFDSRAVLPVASRYTDYVISVLPTECICVFYYGDGWAG